MATYKSKLTTKFLSYVLLSTDEARFTNEGIFNMYNTHIQSNQNPYAIRWVPYRTLHDNVTTIKWSIDSFLNALFKLLQDLPLDILANMWYLRNYISCQDRLFSYLLRFLIVRFANVDPRPIVLQQIEN